MKVLAEFGRTPTVEIARLYGLAERLPVFALSYLADALAASNDRGPRYRDVVRRLSNALRLDADRAHVEEVDDDALAWLWNSNVRATAVVLDGIARRKDDAALVAPLARWLLAARTNGRWGTTQENAVALEALVAYYRAFESRGAADDGVGRARIRNRRHRDVRRPIDDRSAGADRDAGSVETGRRRGRAHALDLPHGDGPRPLHRAPAVLRA